MELPQIGEFWAFTSADEDDLDYYYNREIYDPLINIPHEIREVYVDQNRTKWVTIRQDAKPNYVALKVSWLTQVHKEPTILACVCYNIWDGCTCGAFKKEMEAKGKVYCTTWKMYVPKK